MNIPIIYPSAGMVDSANLSFVGVSRERSSRSLDSAIYSCLF